MKDIREQIKVGRFLVFEMFKEVIIKSPSSAYTKIVSGIFYMHSIDHNPSMGCVSLNTANILDKILYLLFVNRLQANDFLLTHCCSQM